MSVPWQRQPGRLRSVGSWGTGPFDNDDATDFLGDLPEMTESAQVVEVFGDALVAVTAAGHYVEAREMCRAMAAVGVVALFAQASLPTPSVLEQSWLDSVRVNPPGFLRSVTTQLLVRAFQPENNEWHELWADAGLLGEVRAALAPYASALGAESV